MPERGIHSQKTDPILDVNNLQLWMSRNEKKVNIISGVSFGIKKGEIFGLVGESGSGKSLTALSIMRLVPPFMNIEGEVFFRQKNQMTDLLSLPADEVRKIRGNSIAMVFQEPMTSLNPVFTIGRQIGEVLEIHRGLSKRESRERAVELLSRVMIPEPEKRVDDFPHQLSGGMRQRVMIAMAIACSPELLIADEPTTALDVTIQAEIIDLLSEIQQNQGMSVLFISHDLHLIKEIAHRVAIMYAGILMEEAPAEELFSNPLHPYTQGLLNSLPTEKGKELKPIPGNVPSPGELPQGCPFGPRCQLKTVECEKTLPSMINITATHSVRCIHI